jgi:hypothetical protein
VDVLSPTARIAYWLTFIVLAGIAAFIVGDAIFIEERTPPRQLTEVYTPSFRQVPDSQPLRITMRELRHDLLTPRGRAVLRSVLPSEGGVLWLALLLTLAIGFDFERLDNPRNVDLIAMQAIGLCLFESLRFLEVLHVPEAVRLMDWVFAAVFALNVFLAGRAVWRVDHPPSIGWQPGLGTRALAACAIALVACDVAVAMVREPDDVGYFVNLGAQRLRERGALPYGDPLLTGSAGAAYGPLLYVAHLPFQFVLAPHGVNRESPDRPTLGAASTYYLPPQLATKLCTVSFHLLGIFALFAAATGLADRRTAWALVALYAGSAYVLGVGGENYFIGGMTYISHIAPTAVTLAAFAALSRPAAAGVGLALAAGVGFYPAFMAPAWLGYFWDRTTDRWQFAAGFLTTAVAIGVGVLLLSHPAGDRGLVGTILADTFGHHTDPRGYGRSPFSFWGQRAGVRGWLMHPLVAGSGFSSPIFLLFVALSVALFWKARHRPPRSLALLSAVIAIAASLLKIHPTGTYVAWAYPFLLIGLFA